MHKLDKRKTENFIPFEYNKSRVRQLNIIVLQRKYNGRHECKTENIITKKKTGKKRMEMRFY